VSCFYPVDAWRSRRTNENGKRPIVFQRSAGFSDMALQVPCGKCDGCKADKALTWALRIHNEASLHDKNCFMTITYDDAHLPEDGKINKDHMQRFLKRLRHTGQFRYYAVGEYGGKTQRPHYHAIVFGQDFLAGSNIQINSELYTDSAISDCWGSGSVILAPFTMATACYVAGYVSKKIGDHDSFHLMSRRPGIGKEWLARNISDVRRSGKLVIEGREYPVPPRYLVWKEDELFHVKQERSERFKNMPIEKRIDMHRERRAREVYAKQKVENRRTKEVIGQPTKEGKYI